jgi:hypothetical protein
VFELGVDDCVELARLVAAGVADGLLAFGVGPAGAVGDQLAVAGTIDRAIRASKLGSDARRDLGAVVGGFAQAARSSSSARCLSDVSSNDRWTWLVRLVYRRP